MPEKDSVVCTCTAYAVSAGLGDTGGHAEACLPGRAVRFWAEGLRNSAMDQMTLASWAATKAWVRIRMSGATVGIDGWHPTRILSEPAAPLQADMPVRNASVP